MSHTNLFAKLLILFCLLPATALSQQSPTLAVGLETLTLKKGDIDVEALTAIIMEKQRELKHEALRRFMLSMFPESNYTTKYYVQNCLNILLYETNPQVIEKEILELTTNYALAVGIATVLHKDNDSTLRFINQEYLKYTDNTFSTASKLLTHYADSVRREKYDKKTT